MSWDVDLEKNGKSVDVARHTEGGTYVLGGSIRAELNISYNYSPFYYKHLDNEDGLRWLHGKKAVECISRLKSAILKLGITRDSDYWKATHGNAGAALNLLLKWAESNPEAKFRIN